MDTNDLVAKSRARYYGLVASLPIKPKKVDYVIGGVNIQIDSKNVVCIDDNGRIARYNENHFIDEMYCFLPEHYLNVLNAICT